MKSDKLSNLYEQILLSEAAKSADLTNAKNDVVGDLKNGEEAFEETPELVGGPEKQKIAKGPSYKISTSSETAPQATSSKHIFDGSKPAKSEEGEEAEEVKGTRVVPKTGNKETEEDEKSHEDSDLTPEKDDKKDKYNKYKYKQQESFTMNAFETLFKKTLLEQEVEEMDTPSLEASDEVAPEVDSEATEEPSMDTEESEDSDLITDLKDLQDKLSNILSRLEGVADDEEAADEESLEDGSEESSYDEEDFDAEFGEESADEDEAAVKESVDKPKPLSDKSKKLQSKDNKVGKVKPKGGKAYIGSFKNEPKPKALSASSPKSKGEVKSTVSKGDFIK